MVSPAQVLINSHSKILHFATSFYFLSFQFNINTIQFLSCLHLAKQKHLSLCLIQFQTILLHPACYPFKISIQALSQVTHIVAIMVERCVIRMLLDLRVPHQLWQIVYVQCK